jgi:hypothetical protein
VKAQLRPKLESFYYNAHRLLTLIEVLPGTTDFKFIGVKVVRNKLIEHAENGSLYSFGWSDNGPLVKPEKLSTADPRWQDKGLLPNTIEMIAAVSNKLRT